jgi:hypothetical protein
MTKNKQTVIEITIHNLRFGKDRTPKMAAWERLIADTLLIWYTVSNTSSFENFAVIYYFFKSYNFLGSRSMAFSHTAPCSIFPGVWGGGGGWGEGWWLLLFRVLVEWQILKKSAYAKEQCMGMVLYDHCITCFGNMEEGFSWEQTRLQTDTCLAIYYKK